MNKFSVHPYQSHEEWLSLRRKFIGGSDIAAICGLHPYKTPLQVWLEKKGRSIEWTSEKAELGHKLEPIIREMYEQKEGHRVFTFNEIYSVGIAGASLDGIISNVMPGQYFNTSDPAGDRLQQTWDGVFEAKHPGWRQAPRWDNNQAPEEYRCQVVWYMGILGLEWADIAALIGGDDWQTRRIEFDAELFGLMMQRAEQWWRDYIIGDKEPDAEAQDSEVLSQLHRPDPALTVDLAPEDSYTVLTYCTLDEQIKKLAAEKEKCESLLKQKMMGYSQGFVDGYRIDWKEQTQQRLDTKRLKAERPDIYKEYVKETTSKPFNVRRKI